MGMPAEVVARAEQVDAAHARVAGACTRLHRAHAELVDTMVELLAGELWAEGGIRSPEHWLQVRAGLSPARARDVVRLARRAGELPEALELMRAGRLGLDQASVVAVHVPATHTQAATELAQHATVGQLQRALSRYGFSEVGDPDEVTPEGAPAEHGVRDTGPDAFAERPSLRMGPGRRGRFGLRFDAPADLGAVVEAAIREATEALTGQTHPDPASAAGEGAGEDPAGRPTLADGLVDLARRALEPPGPDSEPTGSEATGSADAADAAGSGESVEASDTTGADAAEDADTTAAADTDGVGVAADAPADVAAAAARAGGAAAVVGSRPGLRRRGSSVFVHLCTGGGWLGAGGALPAHILARLTCDGVLRPVWESGGHPVNVGRAQRIVPERVRRLILARDMGCRYPGCGVTRGLEVHHIRHWRDGGLTGAGNLVTLCGYHHDRHHDGLYSITGDPARPDGLVFTARGGRPLRPLTVDDLPVADPASPDPTDPDGSSDPAGPDGTGPPGWTSLTGETMQTKWLYLVPNEP